MKKLFILLLLLPSMALAAVCESIFDGDSAVSVIQGKPANYSLNLINSAKNASQGEVTATQIQAVYNAKEKIQRLVGIYPKYVICGDAEPNAFAFEQSDGAVVGVSVGMLKLIDGDEDMAAAVIGHEIAHHTKNHRIRSQQNQLVTNILSSLLGIYVESKVQQKYRVTGVGQNLAVIGSALTLSKFSRDHEREADEVGLQYMVDAGYNPEASIRLAEIMLRKGFGGAGLFYDSHPSWDERATRVKSFIAENSKAQNIIAKSGNSRFEGIVGNGQSGNNSAQGFNSSFNLTEAQINSQLAIKALSNKDLVLAEKYSRLASDAGEPSAQYNLGVMYEKGDVVQKDINEAIRLVKLSAMQGFTFAQAKMGFYYAVGLGVQKDLVESVKWTRLAANNGDPTAQHNIALAYLKGEGVNQNQAEAMKWYKLSAEQGNVEAQVSLGSMYYFAANYQDALKWFKLAAAQNNGGAYSSMGTMYLNGLGVSKDSQEAMRLFKLAAKYGYQPVIDYFKKNNISY